MISSAIWVEDTPSTTAVRTVYAVTVCPLRLLENGPAMDPDSRTRAAIEEHWRASERGETEADGQIGRVDPAGTVSSMPALTPDGSPYGLCAGPDRSVWIALETGTLIHLTESD